MWPKLCLRLGGIIGAFTGLLCGALRFSPCCGTPPHAALSFGRVTVVGLVVAFIVMLCAVAFAVLVTHRPVSNLLPIGLLLVVLIALFVSEAAYALGNLIWLATLFGGIVGAVLGWIVCWLWCGRHVFLPPKGSGNGIGECVELLRQHGYQVVPPTGERGSK